MAVFSYGSRASLLATRIVAVAFALTLTLAGQGAAETYTLEQCLKLAKESRASIARARGDQRNAAASVKRQFSIFLPNLSATYRNSESTVRNQEQTQPLPGGGDTTITFQDQDRGSSRFDITGSITLFNGLSNIHDYLGVKKSNQSAKLDLVRAEQNLDLEVKTRYFAYLANVRNLVVQEEAVKRSQEQLNLVQSRYDVGSASLSDVLKQKVQFGNDNLTLLGAENGVATSKADLAFAVGFDPNDDDDFDTTYVEEQYAGTMVNAISIGLKNHPGLRARTLDVDVSRHFVRSAYGEYLPRVSAFVSQDWSDGSRSDNIVSDVDFSSNSTTAGLTVSWNIFDRYLREQNVIRNRVALNNARAEEWEARNAVSRDVRTAFLDAQKAKRQVEVSTETVASAREDMNLAQEKYNLGSASILDLLDAQVSLTDAQVSLIRSKLDLNLAVAKLENAMGASK
ncbi:MAG: TolC family protein [Candidatus Zixiibacteriota bacterium]